MLLPRAAFEIFEIGIKVINVYNVQSIKGA